MPVSGQNFKTKAAVLWTGGKDSALAFYKARTKGYEIVCLLTFVPKGKTDFRAHPLPFMKRQAGAIGIPHYEIPLEPPLEAAYEKAIRSFRQEYKIDTLITGDIAEVDGYPNWIRQRSADSGIKVVMPLWGMDRCVVFDELLGLGFRAAISYIKKGCLGEEWLGRELDRRAFDDLREVNKKTGIDICGENGEYHTLVFDGPIFKKTLKYEKDDLFMELRQRQRHGAL